MTDLTPEPFTDDELRADMANGWAPHAAQLAAELLAARARITELEASVQRVTTLADKWDNTHELETGSRSIVAGAFSAVLLEALEGNNE